MSLKIAFVSLGCDKNLVDSEIMLGIINENGYTIIDDEYLADIIIINTCGFILDATQEGIDNVLQLASYKKEGKCKGLIVTGCMVQRYKEELFKELPEVDAVLGTSDFEEIANVIKRVEKGEKVSIVSDGNKELSETSAHKRMITTPPHFSFLKIAEGCDNRCTYCIIPYLRGDYRSRTIESLVQEAKILVEKGVRELVLVAQDTALYGKDIYGKPSLHILLKKLSSIEELKWIRILYAYPEHIDNNLIEEIKINDKVLKYLDMPVQHSEDKILKRMARRSNRKSLVDLISNIRKEIPEIIFRTTIIVGFPDESEEDFEGLINFIEEVQFDKVGVFTYSQEDGTPAATFDNQIDEDVKIERKDKLMQVQTHISARKMENHIGKELEIVVDGYMSDEEVFVGRGYMDTYEIDGLVFFKADYEILSGTFVKVKITGASDYDLTGDLIG
ncbi:MAG: 30S ribosomal protein S12 methylthiotransferase RimO [Lachnospirales bacterium]